MAPVADNALEVIGADVGTCQVFGRERAKLRAARTMIGDFDLQIESL